MEHAQRAHTTRTNSVDSVGGLNPYFNGTCSKRLLRPVCGFPWKRVLILILMEHAQRAVGRV